MAVFTAKESLRPRILDYLTDGHTLYQVIGDTGETWVLEDCRHTAEEPAPITRLEKHKLEPSKWRIVIAKKSA